jgi:hypothetical protein
MRDTGEEEGGGSDVAPGRNKSENTATMQPDRRCSFMAEVSVGVRRNTSES